MRSWWEMTISVASRFWWMALKVSVSLAKDHRSVSYTHLTLPTIA